MFTRVGAIAFKKDLTNTIALCDVLGNPQQHFESIHIAGTNGKGSTSHMLASVLQEAGFKVGLYTSPHLKDFRERIKVNGNLIPEEAVIQFVANYKPLFDAVKPSFFEWTVALAFDYFAHEKVDIAIIETGLGGRLDSTNIIEPKLSVITNIGWDHMDMLGDTLPKIAFEKAGIIKPNIPVVIGEYHAETFPVFEQKAKQENASIIHAPSQIELKDVHFSNAVIHCSAWYKGALWLDEIQLPLAGIYQQHNLKTVLAALKQLISMGVSISIQHIILGLNKVIVNTGLHGRWQVLNQKPLTICDTGHNLEGIQLVVQQLLQQTYHHLHIVFGMVKDKDISKVLSILPKEATYYFCQADIPRALPAQELQEQAKAFQLVGETFITVQEALSEAQERAGEQDLIFIGGSTFIVAEVI